jgi:hypothetical protein
MPSLTGPTEPGSIAKALTGWSTGFTCGAVVVLTGAGAVFFGADVVAVVAFVAVVDGSAVGESLPSLVRS